MRKSSAALVLLVLGFSLLGRDGRSQAPAAAAIPPAAPQATQAVMAKPALWQVKGAHRTVYLFGTVHVMQKGVSWETPKVDAAMKASDTVYLEIAGVDDEAMKAAQPIVLAAGIDAEHPLSTKIGKEDIAKLDTAAKSAGMAGEDAFEPMRPWLVYLTLSVLPAIQAGYDPANGVDKMLDKKAVADGKQVKGFETVTSQIHLLSDMPEREQIALLKQQLDDLPKSREQMDEIAADWSQGDVEALAKLENDELKVKTPALYDKLLVKRNEHFAAEIAKLLDDPAGGTVFVGLGAGHLAGPDSVNAMLVSKGYTVERIE